MNRLLQLALALISFGVMVKSQDCTTFYDCGNCLAQNGACTWCASTAVCLSLSSTSAIQSCGAIYSDTCPSPERSYYELHKAAIIGTIVGLVLLVIIVSLTAIYCCCHKKQKRRRERFIAQQENELQAADAVRHEHIATKKAYNKTKYDVIRKKYNIFPSQDIQSGASV